MSKKEELAGGWGEFSPIEKAAAFKLMEPDQAMAFYDRLSADEQYYLLSSFELGSIAPILEDAPGKTRALFRRFTEDCYEHMFRRLIAASAPPDRGPLARKNA